MFNLNTTDLPVDKIKKCMGDPEADVENEVLKNEQQVQVKYLIFIVISLEKLRELSTVSKQCNSIIYVLVSFVILRSVEDLAVMSPSCQRWL